MKRLSKRQNLLLEILLSDICILFVSIYIYFNLKNSFMVIPVGIVCFCINTLRFRFNTKIREIYWYCIKYRYLIALGVFIVCVVFRVSGSSIGVFNQEFYSPNETQELFGQSRSIRSDEFDVQTPYYFSQYYNDYKATSYQMSLSGQDMILGYNAPVKNITLIGKPFVWGYILFGNEVGLSWYWCMKVILFVLVAYEMLEILIRNKFLSSFGALLIVFSPAMQWWFSPHIYDVFFWASTLFVVGYWFFVSKTRNQKIGFTILSIASLTGFILALFPSCQIPLGLLALTLLIVCLFRDKEEIEWKKKDFIRVGCVIFGLAIVLIPFYLTAKDGISLLFNTAYPGKRISTGGEANFKDLFADFTMLLAPFKSSKKVNASEISTFNHLGFICMLYFPYLAYRIKNTKYKHTLRVGYALFVILCIEAIYMLFGFPEWLAKITLFSYINRMKIIYGFTATLFTMWMMSTIGKTKKYLRRKVNLIYSLIFLILAIGVSIPMKNQWVTNNFVYFICIMVFVYIFVCMLFSKQRYAISALMGVVVVSSMTINPIIQGASAIYEHPISDEVQKLVKENDGYWLTLGDLTSQNFLLANGAKVINAVNFYPDVKKWKTIDEDGNFTRYYNRYAHISVGLTSEETSYQLMSQDNLHVQLKVTDLKKWKVKYIMSKQENLPETLGSYGFKVETKYTDKESGFRIIELEY